MRAKINVPILGKRSVSATAETTTSLQQAKRSSRFKVLLVWMIVLLPLAWGNLRDRADRRSTHPHTPVAQSLNPLS